MEEDLGREPHEMHEDTVEAIDRMQEQLVHEKFDQQSNQRTVTLFYF